MRARSLVDNRPSERGSAVVEFALVAPLMITLLMAVVDFGNVLYMYNSMLNAAREASRRVAVAEATVAQGQTQVQQQLSSFYTPNGPVPFSVNITVPVGPPPASQDVTTNVTVPLSQALMLDVFKLASGVTLRATATIRKES